MIAVDCRIKSQQVSGFSSLKECKFTKKQTETDMNLVKTGRNYKVRTMGVF